MNQKIAKRIQLFARIYPFLVYGCFAILYFLDGKLSSDNDPYSFDPETITFVIFAVILMPYLAFIYKLLPTLIFPSIEDNWFSGILFYIFAAATAGLGPVVLYWLKVDNDLKNYISRNNSLK